MGILASADEETNDAIMFVIFCVAPILRIMKITRRLNKFYLFLAVLKETYEALVVLFLLSFIALLVFGSGIYAVEPRENIPSFATALWFSLVSMTTVGYGDVVPESTTGSF